MATNDRLRPRVARRTLLVAVGVLNLELAAVVAYFTFTNARLSSPSFTVYGLCWLTVGALVLWRYDPPTAGLGRRARGGAAILAAGYFLLLTIAGGNLGVTNPATPPGLSVSLLPPGWGPALVYGGNGWSAVVMPARVVGYLALSYLLYGRLASLSGVGVAGLLGVFSCVSCTFPLIAGTVGALVGSGTAAASVAARIGYGPSTAVFLFTVALLWRGPAILDALRQ